MPLERGMNAAAAVVVSKLPRRPGVSLEPRPHMIQKLVAVVVAPLLTAAPTAPPSGDRRDESVPRSY